MSFVNLGVISQTDSTRDICVYRTARVHRRLRGQKSVSAVLGINLYADITWAKLFVGYRTGRFV